MNSNTKPSRGSTVGRPRVLTDAQVEAILEWHRTRKSLKQVARENNVTVNTIQRVIRKKGGYKPCSPEARAATIRARAQQLKKINEGGGLA